MNLISTEMIIVELYPAVGYHSTTGDAARAAENYREANAAALS